MAGDDYNPLKIIQAFPTSGARAVASFSLNGYDFLAVAQLAQDIPGGTAGMNEGDSDVDLIIWRGRNNQEFEQWQRLAVPGGEDVEFFSINGRHFLATASLRSGKGPYNYEATSVVYELVSDSFVEHQRFNTFGAKQWRQFSVGERHFLALAQGLLVPVLMRSGNKSSLIFEWDGNLFQPFQTVKSAWGYNWHFFELDGTSYLAYADFREPSILLRWDGSRFEQFQTMAGNGGRAFCFFQTDTASYLAFADILDKSILYKWTGSEFREHQRLDGPGGREFELVKRAGLTYLVMVKFVQDPASPKTKLDSVIYRLEGGFLVEDHRFITHGATDVLAIKRGAQDLLFVCESLTEDVRFRTDSHLYQFQPRNPTINASKFGGGGMQSPEFLKLYEAYTASSETIATQLVSSVSKSTSSFPLLVATNAEMILFPGHDKEPSFINYRLNNRGFKELAAISHLGPAIASLVQLAASDSQFWRSEAQHLLQKLAKVHEANSKRLWKEDLRVLAYEGREEAIAAMVEYACALTSKFLQIVLESPEHLNADFLRDEYLEGKGPILGAQISMNAVMIATFFLVGLDISYRSRLWLQDQKVTWEKAMVLITGKQGRETAGVTLLTNAVAQGIIQCSDLRLPSDNIYIAPHGPIAGLDNSTTVADLRDSEAKLRGLWNRIYATVGLGETMFSSYPRYVSGFSDRPYVTQDTKQLSEMPRVRGPDDWYTFSTRLRLVLEDPRQLLSGCVTDYAAEQLRQTSTDLSKVIVPGLDGYDYDLATAALAKPELR